MPSEGRPRRALDARSPVDALHGIGAQGAEALGEHGVTCVGHVPWVLPVGFDDLRSPIGVAAALARSADRPRVAVRGVVRASAQVFARGRPAVRVVIGDPDVAPGARGAPQLVAWWFFAAHGVLKLAQRGAEVVLVGRVAPMKQAGACAMAHPDVSLAAATPAEIRPRYARLGLPPKRLATAVRASVDLLSPPPDPVPPFVVEREGMPALGDLLLRVHAPTELPDDPTLAALRERMGYAEAFTRAWERADVETRLGARVAPRMPLAVDAVERVRLELGFAWTEGQARAIAEIAADLDSERPMRRLLFGDVGSGKTAVALAAAAQAHRAGMQVALLAPTTILAEQYLEASGPLARATGARIALLLGTTRAAPRRGILRSLAEGALDVVVGTHALLSDDVEFARLGLVVVDEQQRLGVAQRLTLVRKGDTARVATRPHLLTLSATPIPRTLALAVRGELATSEIADRPLGREPVATRAVARGRFDDEVMPRLRAAIEAGERVLVVCPRIGGDEDEDGVDGGPACLDRAEKLVEALGEAPVVVVHGALSAAKASAGMKRFRSGDASVLVGTTVVEVGVDVPEATLMVVDGAEHFGLSQLHQLRGRVGRGARPGTCLLVHDEPTTPEARARLDALTRIASGLELAREDLRLRGGGDLGGTRQSGDSGLVWLDPFAEPAWLERVPADVARVRASDPGLDRDEHLGLRLAVERLRAAIAVREEAG